jgi:hypothetical protein
MKPSSTVHLRLRGLTRRQLLTSLIAAAPLFYVAYLTLIRHSPLARQLPSIDLICVAAAALPWLSLFAARATYRAKCDDIAIHVRNEALPYKTIRELRLTKTPRRITLHLIRSEDLQIHLVLADAFAGRLEPLQTLRARLSAHNLTFPEL